MGNDNLIAIYEQYWLHARHVEGEMWLFTRAYVLIIGAIFAVIGADIPLEIKKSITAFGIFLSLLGFLIVYALRIPFLNFALRSELIAINEFKIKNEYRRFFPKEKKVFPDKWVDLNDVLSLFYSAQAGVMVFLLINFYIENTLLSAIIAVVAFTCLVGMHYIICKKNDEIVRSIKDNIKEDTTI